MVLLELNPEIAAFPGSATKSTNCQMVIVHFFYGVSDLSALHVLEEELDTTVQRNMVGEYHGNEMSSDNGDGYLFILGDSAEKIFTCVKPLLQSFYFMDRSIVTLRSGGISDTSAKELNYLIRYSKLSDN